MLDKDQDRKKLIVGWLTFMIIAGIVVTVGVSLVLQYAFATNATAINEAQTILQDELTITNSFPVFWIIFALIILAVFIGVMLRMREERESVFFSIGAVIMCVVITLMLTSPVDFDFQETETKVLIIENGTHVIQSEVTQTINRSIIIPADSEFRFVYTAFFTGLSLFLGLYTIFILTNFPLKQTSKIDKN